MATQRIYVISENGAPLALVSAVSQAAAIKHSTANRFSASVATQQELVQLIGDGMTVETAGETAAEEA